MQRLQAYPWPGNVRELENVIERAVILANSATLEIDLDVLALTATAEAKVAAESSANLEDVERDHIRRILQQTDWVIDGPRGAAKVLGLHPNTLRSRMKKMGITRSTHESS
jgi:DNA-binding NtrC family response regulator